MSIFTVQSSTLFIKKEEAFFRFLQARYSADQCFLLVEKTVWDFHHIFLQKCFSFLLKEQMFWIPMGEENKNRQTKEQIEDLLLQKGITKKSCLLICGGGACLDTAAFAAASLFRGIDHILIPTTLLSMLDASIGGKTAINTSFGKNTLGAFHIPKAVWMEPLFLETLPEREKKQAVAEHIKHLLIADSVGFYKWLDQKEDFSLQEVLPTSIQIKKRFVEKDPFDKGMRKWLNFGHTIGHALEWASTLLHGEAIFWGMLMEILLSVKRGICRDSLLQGLEKKLQEENFLVPFNLLQEEVFLQALAFDKKREGKMPSMVFLQEPGKVHQKENQYVFPLKEQEIPFVLQELLRRQHVNSSS